MTAGAIGIPPRHQLGGSAKDIKATRALTGRANPLAQCLPKWEECGAHPWVLKTITKGYKLQFAVEPPTFEKVIFSQLTGHAAVILRDEIVSLLGKNAIR